MADALTTTPNATTLSDAFPVLLGPVRLETGFTDTELLVRVFPDDWAVDTFEQPLTAQEHADVRRFWSAYWQAGGDHEGRLAAWRVLADRAGAGRARHLADSRRPLNPADEPRRTGPGQVVLVVAGSDPVPPADRNAAADYWRAVYRGDIGADTTLTHRLGQARAAHVRSLRPDGLDRPPRTGDRAHADVTVAFLDLAAPAATKTSTWTQAARARLLPDAFTLLGYAGGTQVLNVTGQPVPQDLAVGPDPGTPAADQFRSADGTLHVPDALAWMTDFDRAVAVGMGFRVPLTDALKGGLDRLVAVGLRVRPPDTSRQDLETLLTHQAQSRTGFRLLPQGTPTSNTGTIPSAFGTTDEAADAFRALHPAPPPSPHAAPAVPEAAPPSPEAVPPSPEAVPPSPEAVPAVSGVASGSSEAVPAVSGVASGSSEAVPAVSGVASGSSEAVPAVSGVASGSPEAVPAVSGVASGSSQAGPAVSRADLGLPGADLAARGDGQWLAELLGIDPAVVAAVPGADGTDQDEARAMNAALWPATWGYHLGTTLNPVFGTADLDATRSFFTRFVSGRGPIPALRFGRQPYGVLVTTAFSRLAWADTDPDAVHRRRLNAVLTAAGQDWASLAAGVPRLGADGDPHALLLGILGLHPASVEFHQRYAQSAEDYFNRGNLDGGGQFVLNALEELGLRANLRTLLTRLGYPAGAPDPDAAGRLFVTRQHPLLGPLVDDRPASEATPVRPYTDDGRNYVAWLAAGARADFDTVRLESGFTGGHAPAALLYLLLRHAVLAGYREAALRLSAAAHGLADQAVVAARREPPFVHISERTDVTESRYGLLYTPDQAITGDATTPPADFIPTVLGQIPDLAAQVAALDTLAPLPTARLERLLAEHLDTCGHRLDAWRLGLAHERLFTLRYPDGGAPVRGVHIGAFGWLEDVRPRTAALEPVTLTGDLAQVFTPPGAPPLLHDPAGEGYLHAPSPAHATTAAVLRAGYLADASPDSPRTLAVDLSSDRVRVALTVLDGIRAGQSLGAMLGYRLERGLHDRQALPAAGAFIAALRGAFPLVAGKLPQTSAPPGTPIESVEAGNVVDGLALVLQVTRTGPATYPYGQTGLPQADAAEAAAIDAEVRALVEIHDTLADLSVAEGVYQAVLGNPDRAAAGLDSLIKSGNPPDPDVVRTPRGGRRLNQRFGIQLRAGRSPNGTTPRGSGDPGVDDWLSGLLPDPSGVVCTVTWTDPSSGAAHSTSVSQNDLGLRPIDLLWALRPDRPGGMAELDDRIIGRVQHTSGLPGGALPVIHYTDRIAGKTTFFEISPLVAELRELLLAARPLRPSDVVPAAAAAVIDPHVDDTVDLPRNRPAALASALSDFAGALDAFVHDLGAADPAHRLSGVDGFLTRLADLLLTGDGFGMEHSGWSEFTQWRRDRFGDVQAAVKTATDRMAASLAAANTTITAYDALPASATAQQRYTLLQQAERLLTTTPTSPPPSTPQKLRTIVGTARTAFTNRLNALAAITHTTRAKLADLLSDVTALLPIGQFDAIGLSVAPVQDAVAAFCADLLARAVAVRAEVAERSAAVAAALTAYDAAPDGAGRVTAGTAAIRAALGPDALATGEYGLGQAAGSDWQKSFQAAQKGTLTQHLARDLPLDDWLHGLARVRPRMGGWERITLLAAALGRQDPPIVPVQLPFVQNEPWLGLEIPAGAAPADDRMLYTAHYATSFSPGDRQSGLLVDEWTETIPDTTATTGIAAQYQRPGSEPPQAMLLVTPPVRSGTWGLDDLVAAVTETFDLLRTRAVEPAALDATPYAQVLPAVVLPATPHPITISTDLSANNAAATTGS